MTCDDCKAANLTVAVRTGYATFLPALRVHPAAQAEGLGEMTLMFCPSFTAVEDAIDWFAERGVCSPMLWRGPDGLIRGSGVRALALAGAVA